MIIYKGLSMRFAQVISTACSRSQFAIAAGAGGADLSIEVASEGALP